MNIIRLFSITHCKLITLFLLFLSYYSVSQELNYDGFKKKFEEGYKNAHDVSEYCRKFNEENLNPNNFNEYQDWIKSLGYIEKRSSDDKDEDYLGLLTTIAQRLKHTDDFRTAYYYVYKANELLSTLKDIDINLKKELYILTGLSHYYFRRFDDAAVSFKKALSLSNLTILDSISLYNDLGLIYRDKKDLDQSSRYYLQSLEVSKRHNNRPWIAIVSGNLGFNYFEKNELILARKLTRVDYSISLETGQISSAINALSLEMIIDVREGQFQAAETKKKEIEELLKKEYSTGTYMSYWEAVTDLYDATGNYGQAYNAYKNLVKTQDSLIARRDKENTLRTEFQVQFESQLGRVKLLEEKKKRSDFVIYGLTILAIVVIVTFSLILYQFIKRRKGERELARKEKEMLDQELSRTEREMRRTLNNLMEKNEMIELMSKELDLLQTQGENGLSEEKQEIKDKLQSFTLLTDDDWLEFKKLFEKLNPGFFDSLLSHFTDLTNAEIRLFTLLKLNLSNLEMSRALGISPDSVRKTSLRLRKKINLNESEELIKFVHSI